MQKAQEYDTKVKEEIAAKKTRNVLQGILSTIDKRHLEHAPSYPDVIKLAIVQYHLDNNLLIRKFQLRTYYDTIMCKHDIKFGLSLFDF